MKQILLSEVSDIAANNFMYDSSNGDIQFLTWNEVDKYKEKENISFTKVEADGSSIAKLAINGVCDLFVNEYIKFCVTLDPHVGCLLKLYALDNNIMFLLPSMEVDGFRAFFNWYGISVREFYSYIPNYYAEFLITNKRARKRELNKIMNFTKCKCVDTQGHIKVGFLSEIPRWR